MDSILEKYSRQDLQDYKDFFIAGFLMKPATYYPLRGKNIKPLLWLYQSTFILVNLLFIFRRRRR